MGDSGAPFDCSNAAPERPPETLVPHLDQARRPPERIARVTLVVKSSSKLTRTFRTALGDATGL